MKALFTSAMLAALLLAVSAPPASAQSQFGANAPRFKIAVVDISFIFKEHSRFKQQIESMKQKMTALDKQFTQEREAIAKEEEKRNQFKPTTPQFKELDNQITQMKANLAVRAEQEQKSILQEEANMYYTTYLEVQDAIKQYAERHGLALVLRFDGDEVDPSIRTDIIRGINRNVVYQNFIDITPDILAMVNRSVASAPVRPGEGGTIPPRQ